MKSDQTMAIKHLTATAYGAVYGAISGGIIGMVMTPLLQPHFRVLGLAPLSQNVFMLSKCVFFG